MIIKYWKKAKLTWLINSLFFLLSFAAQAQSKFISFSDPHLQYQGRIQQQQDAASLSWSGSSVSICFKGTSISAVLQDSDTSNYYNVVIDGSVVNKIHTGKNKETYLLATGLKNKKHKVQLFKRTEWIMGATNFYGFETAQKAKVLSLPPLPEKKIEFYGNSITCGYAVEDFSGKDRGIGHFENNYISYSAITARHFNAQYSCIARSGIGIMVSWFPQIMPELYNRISPTDTTTYWNFDNYTPDIVVVNLFQNDSWLVERPTHQEFKNRFGTEKPGANFIVESYRHFIESLRTKYPNTNIICVLGNMDATKEGSPWPSYVQQAVAQLHDPKVYTHFFADKQTGGHPNIQEQQTMAASLIAFINQNIQW